MKYQAMSIDVSLMRDWQKLMSAKLHGYYDGINDKMLEDLLSQAEAQSDKLAAMMKDIAQVAMLDSRRFDEQHAKVLDELERSFTLLEPKVVRFPAADNISYLGDIS